MLVPVVLALAVPVVARMFYPDPRLLELPSTSPPLPVTAGFPGVVWVDLVSVALVALSVLVQLAALPVFVLVTRREQGMRGEAGARSRESKA